MTLRTAGSAIVAIVVGACSFLAPTEVAQPQPAGVLVTQGMVGGVQWQLFAEHNDGEICLRTRALGVSSGGCQRPDGRTMQGMGSGSTSGGPTVAHGLVSADVERVRVEARLADGQRVEQLTEAVPLADLDVELRAWGAAFPEGATVLAAEALDAAGLIVAREELGPQP